ncbi:MAG: hypothetical protein K2J70_06300 [Muribaculaceae bacterium]|nr:hypothetical protein [Muribaculaceae bacterium]
MRQATIYFFLFICLAMLSSCKTVPRYVPMETVRTEYREADTSAIFNNLLKIFESRKEKESKSDSLVDREKETVVLNVHGDTVRQIQTKYVYRATQREKELETENKTLRDSLSSLNTRLESIKTDSITSIVPVERELSKWEKVKMDFGGMAIGGLITVVVLFIIAWLIKKFKK